MKRVIKAGQFVGTFSSQYYGLPEVGYNGEKGLIKYQDYVFDERALEQLIRDGEFGNFDSDKEEIDQYMYRTLVPLLKGFVKHPENAEFYDLIVARPGENYV